MPTKMLEGEGAATLSINTPPASRARGMPGNIVAAVKGTRSKPVIVADDKVVTAVAFHKNRSL